MTGTGAARGDLTAGPALAGKPGNLLIDGSADLPGPGAVSLTVNVDIL